MTVQQILSLVLVLPLLAAALIATFGRRRGALAAFISVTSAGIQAALTLYVLYTWNGETVLAGMDWLTLGSLTLSAGLFLNPLSALLLFVVTFVGFWIHVFSIGYMREDDSRGRFFGGLSIFMFSMTGIVLADNLFMMFVFWELVGFSSYMLIGHYLTLPDARSAAKKAFIVNRVGDLGFILGIIFCLWHYGTVSLPELQQLIALEPGYLALPVATSIGLLLFCGAVGKSAQMPLHVWLPDAMAGPTPVSALIHAATMVAAGVFLLGRIWFLCTPNALNVILIVGTLTAFSAAIWAFAQNDIKKILAYSTLSQLGYMVAVFALGTLYGGAHAADAAHAHTNMAQIGVGAANFHLMTHAFFKALLFLAAGSVIHACHHEQDIFRMGGLFKKMPVTGLTFLIGLVALAGLPPFAGFWSKDAILHLASLQNPLVFWVLAATALLTAMYMGRLFVIAFLGKPRTHAVEQAHESPFVMTLPLIALAACSVVGGFEAVYPASIGEFLHGSILHPEGADKTRLIVVSLVIALGGIGLAWLIYRPGSEQDNLQVRAKPLWAVSKSRFFFDEIYNYYVEKVQQRFADLLGFLDTVLINGLIVRGTAGIVGLFGFVGRSLHTGNLHNLVWWFFAGVLIYAAIVFGIF